VWRWADWPGRWGGDAGIDLVAEDHEGRLWAIQAKCYDPAYSVTKADVDTFLSESSRAIFGFRLLVATTDRLGTTARRTIEAQATARHSCRAGGLECFPTFVADPVSRCHLPKSAPVEVVGLCPSRRRSGAL
jgi:hypothetical protein